MHSVRVGNEDAPHRVVFLHGLFGRGKNFTRVATALGPEAQCLLVDLPNHAGSGWTEHFVYEQMADLIAAHLRADFAANGPVDIVGHSMGGKVAMILTLRHPDLVHRLVVIDIAPGSSTGGRGNFTHLLGSLAAIDLAQITRRSDAENALSEQVPDPAVRNFLLQNLKRDDQGYTWEANLAMLRAELAAVMGFPDTGDATFTGPVMWIGGGNSSYVSDEDEPAMRELFPKTVRVTVKGSGHWVHSEKPEETIAALRAFLVSTGR
nr:alpha/beta fold hydrolase [Leucobacter exalbidus]